MNFVHSIGKFRFFQRQLSLMKHRDAVFKENIDIRRVLLRPSLPFHRKFKAKLLDNQKKIIIFLSFCAILNTYPLYAWILRYEQQKKSVAKYIKSKLLNGVYPPTIEEQYFRVKLSRELLLAFLEIDQSFHFGFTRKLIIRALKEMGIYVEKEKLTSFYKNSSYLNLIQAKLSSINPKELQITLMSAYKNQLKYKSFDEFQKNFIVALDNVRIREQRFQNVHLDQIKQEQRDYFKEAKLLLGNRYTADDVVKSKAPFSIKQHILKFKESKKDSSL